MGTISNKLQRIIDTKEDIRNAINEKGVEVDSSLVFKEYANKIREIATIETDEPLVGDIRQEGIVVYVDPDNPKRFLLMSKDEYDLEWRLGDSATTKIDGLGLDDGRSNCNIIWNLPEYTENPDNFPIFKAAKEYGDGNWFIASRNELDHLFEYLLDWNRGDIMSYPDNMPNTNKQSEIISEWESKGLTPIDISSSTGIYWVSSQWEVNPLYWGEGVSSNTFTSNGITGNDPTKKSRTRFFKWVEPNKEEVTPKSYGGYTKDPAWPNFAEEIKSDPNLEEFSTVGCFCIYGYYTVTINTSIVDRIVTSEGKIINKEDITSSYTFDKSKDLTDSTGEKFRWIKVYTNSYYVRKIQGCKYAFSNGEISNLTDIPRILECIETLVPNSTYNLQWGMKCIITPDINEDNYLVTNNITRDNNVSTRLLYPKGLISSDKNDIGNFQAFENAIINITNFPPSYFTYVKCNKIKLGNTFNFDTPNKVTSIPSEVLEFDMSELNSELWQYFEKFPINLHKLVIPQGFNSNLDLSSCSFIYPTNLVEIINKLADRTDLEAGTLNLGSINLAKLTDEEKLIATNKNWTLA